MEVITIWQLIAVAISALVVWSTMIVSAVVWLSGKFSTLLPASEYTRRHEKLEDRLFELEFWAAQRGFKQPEKDRG